MPKIVVGNTSITVLRFKESDFISLTDIAKRKSDEPSAVIGNWIRNRNTIEYLGIWETLYNPDFKLLEFEGFTLVTKQTFFSACYLNKRVPLSKAS